MEMTSIYTQVVLEDSDGENCLMEYEVAKSSFEHRIAPPVAGEKKSYHTIHDPVRPSPSVFVIGNSDNNAQPVLAEPVGGSPPTPPVFLGLSLNRILCFS